MPVTPVLGPVLEDVDIRVVLGLEHLFACRPALLEPLLARLPVKALLVAHVNLAWLELLLGVRIDHLARPVAGLSGLDVLAGLLAHPDALLVGLTALLLLLLLRDDR